MAQKEQCPAWGQDFNCIEGNSMDDKKPKLIANEYRKIFRPHECDLPDWDAVGFEKWAPATSFTSSTRHRSPLIQQISSPMAVLSRRCALLQVDKSSV